MGRKLRLRNHLGTRSRVGSGGSSERDSEGPSQADAEHDCAGGLRRDSHHDSAADSGIDLHCDCDGELPCESGRDCRRDFDDDLQAGLHRGLRRDFQSETRRLSAGVPLSLTYRAFHINMSASDGSALPARRNQNRSFFPDQGPRN